MPAPGVVDGPQPRRFWFPVICGAAILTIGIGARQSFGIFQKPIAADRKIGRELWSLANALAMLLWARSRPFSATSPTASARRHTVATGGLLYVAGKFHDRVRDLGPRFDARQSDLWDWHGGGPVQAELRRHQPADAAREALSASRPPVAR